MEDRAQEIDVPSAALDVAVDYVLDRRNIFEAILHALLLHVSPLKTMPAGERSILLQLDPERAAPRARLVDPVDPNSLRRTLVEEGEPRHPAVHPGTAVQ